MQFYRLGCIPAHQRSEGSIRAAQPPTAGPRLGPSAGTPPITMGTGRVPKLPKSARSSPDGGLNRRTAVAQLKTRASPPARLISAREQEGGTGTPAAIRVAGRGNGAGRASCCNGVDGERKTTSETNDQKPIRCQHTAPQMKPNAAESKTSRRGLRCDAPKGPFVAVMAADITCRACAPAGGSIGRTSATSMRNPKSPVASNRDSAEDGCGRTNAQGRAAVTAKSSTLCLDYDCQRQMLRALGMTFGRFGTPRSSTAGASWRVARTGGT